MMLAGNSLSLRIARRLAALAGVLILVTGALAALDTWYEEKRGAEDRLAQLAASHAVSLAQSIFLVDIPQTQAQLRGMSRFPDVSHIAVHTVIGKSYRSEHTEGRTDDAFSVVTVPLEINGQQIGRLELGASRSELIRRVGNRLAQILLAQLVLLCLDAAVLFYFVNREASRPITDLARRLQNYRPGDLDTQPIPLDRAKQSDELADLAASFNRMQQAIADKITKEHQLQRELAASHDRLADVASTRERSLNYLEGFGQLVLHMSSGFINLPLEAFGPEIERRLQEVADHIAIDCVAIIEPDQSSLLKIQACTRPDQATMLESPDPAQAEAFAHWIRMRLASRQALHFDALSKLRGEDARRHAPLAALSIEAVFSVPLQIRDRNYGLLICATFGKARVWNEQELSLLELVAQIAASALSQRDMLRDLDASHRRLAEFNRDLEILARTDSLTGLPNRREFDETHPRELARSLRSGDKLALAVLDIDFFKAYNDSLGHSAGDLCLANFAKLLRNSCRRPTDLPARLGGEEFALLLPSTNLTGACELALALQRNLAEAKLLRPASPIGNYLTVSIGVAEFDPLRHPRFDDLYAEADAALYAAKDGGRDCIMAGLPPQRISSPKVGVLPP